MDPSFDSRVSLAVETSGRTGSVALARGDRVVAAHTFDTHHNHGVELLPAIAAISEQAGVKAGDIEEIYVSAGPGSFTGLRIGITCAKSLALASAARLVRVPSLDVVAQNARLLDAPPARVVAILDAKRGNVYCAAFDRQAAAYMPIDQPAERDPATYLQSLGPVVVLGDGLLNHAATVAGIPNATTVDPAHNAGQAAMVVELGRKMAAAGEYTARRDLLPIYIRRPDAEEKWERLHGSA